MLDLSRARTAILRELDAVIERLREASGDEWTRPVRCEGWRVLDLALHLTDAPRATADACRRMVRGVGVAGERPPSPAAEPDQIFQCLRAGRAELSAAMAALTPASLAEVFPLYFITVPGALGLQLTTVEIGIHHNDLEWALDGEQPLPADIVEAAAVMVPHILLFGSRVSSQKPAAPLVFKITGQDVRFSLRFDREWDLADEPSFPTCEIAGDDSAVVLFALGRISSTHHSLKVLGDDELAASFKTFFPGP